MYSHSSGDWKPKVKVLVAMGLPPLKVLGVDLFQASLPASGSLECSLVCKWLPSPCVSSHDPPSVHVCLCVQISPFYKDTSHIELGPTLMTLCYLDYFRKDPISR